jgi:predicted membrane-bound dolichyl-phosphate-mannose-protein mannosyltransferase
MMEMIMVPVFYGGSPWGPRMIAAVVWAKACCLHPRLSTIMMVAMFIHFGFSLILALLFIHRPRPCRYGDWFGGLFSDSLCT